VCNNDWPRAINFFLGHISAAFVLSRLLLTHASIIYSFPGEMTIFFPSVLNFFFFCWCAPKMSPCRDPQDRSFSLKFERISRGSPFFFFFSCFGTHKNRKKS
jgi:hypothetical protein